MGSAPTIQAAIPSVDRVLQLCAGLIAAHGRAAVVSAIREELDGIRSTLGEGSNPAEAEAARIVARVGDRLAAAGQFSLRPVFNLTGTLLHTNLGRALMSKEAAEAVSSVAARAVNLEFDLGAGRRGDRDRHLEKLLVELSGAEAATVVNNNAAAVLLALSTLAAKREVLVSRGELIEIGGEFRMPDIMKRAGCRLVEVGTTNRTRLRDYAEAIGARTALMMKVHPSNYSIVGFTESVPEKELATLALERGIPLLSDLGAGALLDLRRWGLPQEPTVRAMIEGGVDLVTCSGDKLLGGPQAGIVAGRADLIARIKRNPLKRALRIDKLRVAALEATLRLYRDPDRLPERLPILRQMTRKAADIESQAKRLQPVLEGVLGTRASVTVAQCQSEAGSGSLPADRLPSFALALKPSPGKGSRGAGSVEKLAKAFRDLPVPVVGRVHDGVLYLDLRALEDEQAFTEQLSALRRDPTAA